MSHTFICAKLKVLMLGRDFLAENRLVENYSGRFLIQIQVQVDQRVNNILRDFPQVTRVSSSGYSKLQTQHGVEHIIETGDARPARRHRARPLFGKKRAAAEKEFRLLSAGGRVSASDL